jgi:hypothetical protein
VNICPAVKRFAEFFEGLFHFDDLQIKFPQFRSVGLGEVGAQEVMGFASPGDPQGLAVELPT